MKASDCKVGDKVEHKWGHYEVKSVESDGCTKEILVHSNQALSLQSHANMSATWTVLEGTLVAVVNGDLIIRHAGEQSVDVPANVLHAMANYGPKPLLVKVAQRGKCSPPTRFRDPDPSAPCAEIKEDDFVGLKSLCLYDAILSCLKPTQIVH